MLQPKQVYTAQEYFAMEETAEYKSEYFYGEIFAMSGATFNHNRIVVNLTNVLFNALKETSCEAFVSDLRVQIRKEAHYTYPDVMVVCGGLELVKGRKDTITNPKVIIEVLSDSTRDYDRGRKFAAYREIESLQEYILVEQDSVRVEAFSKEEDGTWRLREYFNMADLLVLPTLQLKIPIAEIYSRVSLGSKPRLLKKAE
jgi:Uma2 family endonuclease